MPTDRDRLDELTARQGWFYSFRLPDGRVTRDRPMAPSLAAKLQVLQSMDLRGKRILDMGCSEGLYALYAAELGAAEVVGVDIDAHRIEKATFAADALGFSTVRFEHGDVLDPAYRAGLGAFDLVLAWGFLHRVPDPFNALIALGSVSDALSLEWMAFAPPLGRRLSIAHHPRHGAFEWKNIHGIDRGDVRENAKGKQAGRAPFWLLSEGAVEAILSRLGFRAFTAQDRDPGQRRAHLRQLAGAALDRARGRPYELPKDPVLSKRVMLLAERTRGSVPQRDPSTTTVQLAAWHHAPTSSSRA